MRTCARPGMRRRRLQVFVALFACLCGIVLLTFAQQTSNAVMHLSILSFLLVDQSALHPPAHPRLAWPPFLTSVSNFGECAHSWAGLHTTSESIDGPPRSMNEVAWGLCPMPRQSLASEHSQAQHRAPSWTSCKQCSRTWYAHCHAS